MSEIKLTKESPPCEFYAKNHPKKEPIVKPGDRVQFWTLITGMTPRTGTVDRSEIRYGVTYATITPDDSDEQVFLFHGAVWGFEPIKELR
jgi:hypothetical protein